MSNMHHNHRGFTIVELLIVIVVIGILALITTVAYNGMQTRARDTIRINDLKYISKIVELYKVQNGSYPLPSGGLLTWSGWCTGLNNNKTYITGISSVVASALPNDPKWINTDNKCYAYVSNGTDYMALAFNSMETICGGYASNVCNSPMIRAMDRVATTEPATIAIYSPGAVNW